MTDLLTDTLPTVWHGRHIDPDFRHMVWLSNVYRRGAKRTRWHWRAAPSGGFTANRSRC